MTVRVENLEGGLDYLKQVVIEDNLQIAASLEQQMQNVLETYQCEWKTTLENPEHLKRFRPFINDERQDENIQFIEQRGQIFPNSLIKGKHFKLVEEVA